MLFTRDKSQAIIEVSDVSTAHRLTPGQTDNKLETLQQ